MALLIVACLAVGLLLASIDPKPGYVRIIMAAAAVAAFVLKVLEQ